MEHAKDSTRLISTRKKVQVQVQVTYWFTDLISQAVGVWYQHAQHGFHQVLVQDNFLVLVIFLLITTKKPNNMRIFVYIYGTCTRHVDIPMTAKKQGRRWA